MPDIAASQVMKFVSGAVAEDDLQLVGLEGTEEISRPYEFRLELASRKADLDLGKLLRERAHIAVKQGVRVKGSNSRASTTLKIHGFLSSFEEVGKELEWVRYRAVLTPLLWRLSLGQNNRIFQEMSVVEIVEKVLKEHDVKLDKKLNETYQPREYVVQYAESDLDFIHRWLEHEGIYYYFVQDDEEEKLVLSDNREGYGTMQSNAPLRFRPQGEDTARGEHGDSEQAMEDWFREEVVSSHACTQKIVPREVVLNDYNWKTPTTALEVKQTVSDEGVGTVYEYNNHYADENEGKRLAKARAEMHGSRGRMFRGRGDCRGFRAGLCFELEEHFRGDFNQEYLLVQVRHTATQTLALGSASGSAHYHNEFTAMPKSASFRPQRVTAWPSIKGVMHGVVDGADKGTPYAQLDDKGRYKVRLPLDRGGTQDGQASKYVRKAESYAGPGQGMHFPLLKGAEVLLIHVDGDPDRPIIVGAVFNNQHTTVVNNHNHTTNVIQTPVGNMITLDDLQGAPRIVLNTTSNKTKISMDGTDGSEAVVALSTVAGSQIRVGKSQGESTGPRVTNADGVYIGTGGDINLVAGAKIGMNSGGDTKMHVGANTDFFVGGSQTEVITGNYNLNVNGNNIKAVSGEEKLIDLGLKKEFVGGMKLSVIVGSKSEAVMVNETKIMGGIKFEGIKGLSIKLDKSTSHNIGKDDWALKCAKKASTKALGNVEINSVAGEVKIEAGLKISLVCGGSKIELTPAGIKIQKGGSRQTMNPGLTRIKAPSIEVKAGGSLNCKGTPGGQYK